MAAPEDVVTVDAVCGFFALNGGRATNKELVAHFRNPQFDQKQKGMTMNGRDAVAMVYARLELPSNTELSLQMEIVNTSVLFGHFPSLQSAPGNY